MDIDAVEQNIQDISPDLLKILLSDKTTKNILDGAVTIIFHMDRNTEQIKK